MAVGHRDGNTQTHEVNAEKMPEKQEGMYLIKISRVRQRDKEMRFTPEEYKAKTGAVPEVGRRFIFDPALPGKLESVDENEVVVRFGPEPGVEILTPFGKGILRDGGDKWEIVIDARKGDLVRSGALIGKIIEVDDREITIDYSHPFGGETLLCDVEIDLVSKEETATGKQTEFPESGKTNLPTGSPLQTAGKGGRNGGLQEIKKGDVVSVNYTATLEDGSLLFTTYAELAKDQSRRKAPQYKEPKTFGPEEIVAGTSTKVPGIADAVIGMTPGARKQLSLPPETAYGPIDQAKIQTLPTIRSVPRKLSMSPEQFYEQFRVFPMQGRDVQLTPFLTARISEVTPDSAHLELTAKDGEEAEVEYGKVRIRSAADQVIVQLIPKIGTTFKSNTNEGRITRADGETFVVDFNSPLAGRTIGLDVEVVSVSPIPEIAWSEDHDEELHCCPLCRLVQLVQEIVQ
jgi:FKBP-type peptidyl-prolyl cis-trans isomerase 2